MGLKRCSNYEEDDEICKQCSINHMENHNSCYERNETMIRNEFAAEKQHEAVDHPKHYQGKNECIDVMRAMFGDEAVKAFCKCNAFKYRFRAGMKNGEEDIKKAEWYETYLLEKFD